MTTETPPTSPDTETTDPFVGEFGWALTVLLREWTARIEAAVGDLPYGPRGYSVLSMVVHEEPPNQATLAARLGVDRSAITHLIDEYVATGLVERHQDPADRRIRRIVPTERGRTVLAALDARTRTAEQDLLSTLPEPDRHHLRHLLTQLAKSLPHDPDRCGTAARSLQSPPTLRSTGDQVSGRISGP
ncbi:MarR family transcriptional regulator [Thermopolyspora sp. NPDC052614]|uniref:MarR family winged helix-turn-helix transcriptional regulator n=1 Tax=Thermopolyspora sp. NPDC052614 TaxID=3155682 RepID=UPI00343F22AE